MGDERRLFVEHRLFSATRCRCGWEGDSAITHVLDALKTCPELLVGLAIESGAVSHVEGGKALLDPDGEWEDCTWLAVNVPLPSPSPTAAQETDRG